MTDSHILDLCQQIQDLKQQVHKLRIEHKLAQLGDPGSFRKGTAMSRKSIHDTAQELIKKLCERIEAVESRLSAG